MKRNLLQLSFVFISIIFFFSCSKEASTCCEPVATNYSVAGRITDTDGLPISNANVISGSGTTTTDYDGNFYLKDVSADISNSAYVKVTKAGYFNGTRTFLTKGNNINSVSIQLIPKKVAGIFSATAGGNINITGGGLVNFTSNSIIDPATNTPYTGDVKVSAFFLNPESNNFQEYMPGNLLGLNTSNQSRLLKSYGMVAVELNGSAGEQLQIAEGKTASISFPIVSSLLATAPATIPLWYFDESKGLWIEQGIATKNGDKYVGTVSHFTFWNCDIPNDFINFIVNLKDENNNPLQNTEVKITSTKYGAKFDYTDNLGTVTGLVPPNEILTLEISTRDCGTTSIYSKSIGPFSTDIDLGTIITEVPELVKVKISGTAEKCDNTPVINGYASIRGSNGIRNYAAINNGVFSVELKKCPQAVNYTVQAFDEGNNFLNDETSKSVTVTTTDINVGSLLACQDPTGEYLLISVDSMTNRWEKPDNSNQNTNVTVNPTLDETTILGRQIYSIVSRTTVLEFKFGATSRIGQFPLTSLVYRYDHLSSPSESFEYREGLNTLVNITEFGANYITGNASGLLLDMKAVNPGNPYVPFELNFRLKRNN